MAGLTVGFWTSEEEILTLIGPRARFEPGPAAATREERYAGWKQAVTRAMSAGAT
jgi:glycerol kinase